MAGIDRAGIDRAGDPQHAMAVTRAADRDRYLSVLYAPAEKRAGLFSLYAFNAEDRKSVV